MHLSVLPVLIQYVSIYCFTIHNKRVEYSLGYLRFVQQKKIQQQQNGELAAAEAVA